MWNYDNRNPAKFEELCKKGSKLIQASYEHYYLDCGLENYVKFGNSWCEYNSWKDIYSLNVSTVAQGLPAVCHQNLIGATVSLWTETISPYNLMNTLFPRSFALAERLWTNPRAGFANDTEIWLGSS